MTDLEEFTAACIEAMYFTDTGTDQDIPADAELSNETRLDLEADCRSFWHRYGCFVEVAECSAQFSNAEMAGHDVWMTRNGHGAGFWDGDWDARYGAMFTKGSNCYGEFQIYLGDDGLIYK